MAPASVTASFKMQMISSCEMTLTLTLTLADKINSERKKQPITCGGSQEYEGLEVVR